MAVEAEDSSSYSDADLGTQNIGAYQRKYQRGLVPVDDRKASSRGARATLLALVIAAHRKREKHF